MPPLDGRVALVTGAGSGIGRATALRLAADGAAGGLAIPVVADVTDRTAVEAAVATVAIELGAIGILVLSPNGGMVFPG